MGEPLGPLEAAAIAAAEWRARALGYRVGGADEAALMMAYLDGAVSERSGRHVENTVWCYCGKPATGQVHVTGEWYCDFHLPWNTAQPLPRTALHGRDGSMHAAWNPGAARQLSEMPYRPEPSSPQEPKAPRRRGNPADIRAAHEDWR